MARTYMRPRHRAGLVVGLEEIRGDIPKARELITEMMMQREYIGYIDLADEKMRVFIFEGSSGAAAALDSIKSMNYRTAGLTTDPIFISNHELKRPHLAYTSKDSFYKELYK